jgi:hypothetical protein
MHINFKLKIYAFILLTWGMTIPYALHLLAQTKAIIVLVTTM